MSAWRLAWASLAIVLVCAGIGIGTILYRGWVPFDEGTIALAGERVLHGALPHRDFVYPYTGALPYWHALAMRVFGVSLLAPRNALFLAMMGWLPAVWWLARRACGLGWAAVLTVLAAGWSVQMYPAAMPTWYLLFLATWSLVALERWRATRRVGWLVGVGVACGVAVIIKQTGLYVIAGSLLGMLLLDQEEERASWRSMAPAGRTDLIILLALGTLGALVVLLLARRLRGSGELLHLLFPTLGVLTLTALREWRLTSDGVTRWKRLGGAVAWCMAGVAVPVAGFLWPYLQAGALHALIAGAIGDGVRKIGTLQRPMPSALTVLFYAWPMFLLMLLEMRIPKRAWQPAAFGALGIVLVGLAFLDRASYLRLWLFALAVLPLAIAAVLAAGYRAWRRAAPIDPLLLATAAMTAFQALNQYPYSGPNYYGYVAPLALLTAAMAAAHFGTLSRHVMATVALAGFAATVMREGSVQTLGYASVWWDDAHRLAGPRGGLRVTAPDSARYARVLELVARHRGTGTIYAGPELPEVYFLAGAVPPVRDPYDILAPGTPDSTSLAQTFDVARARVLVLKSEPMFAPPLPPDVRAWLVLRYPFAEQVEGLEIRWR